MKRRCIGTLLLVGLAAGALASGPARALEVTVSRDQVVVAGATPGGKVALVGRLWRFEDMARTVASRSELAADTDSDGSVEFSSGGGSISVWGAVDVGSGSFAFAVPAGEQVLSTVTFPADGLLPGPSETSLQRLSFPSELFIGLWVRPGVGAWRLGVADGAAMDLDGFQDGRATTEVTAAEALDPAVPAPSSFATGDVLVIVDSETLAVSQTVVP